MSRCQHYACESTDVPDTWDECRQCNALWHSKLDTEEFNDAVQRAICANNVVFRGRDWGSDETILFFDADTKKFVLGWMFANRNAQHLIAEYDCLKQAIAAMGDQLYEDHQNFGA